MTVGTYLASRATNAEVIVDGITVGLLGRSGQAPRRRTLIEALRTAARIALGVVALCQTVADARAETQAAADTGFLTELWSRDTLLDDAGGLRTRLSRAGLSLGLQDFNEVFGNVSGGVRTGAAYSGLTMLSIGLDTKAAFGWEGGIFNASLFNIRGRGLSADNLLALQTVSGIVAVPTTRLWELWFQQSFGERFDVKLGQQSLDVEFMTSQGSSVFLNTMMGWPMLPSADLYAGGPAYPLSSLGVRFRARPSESITILAGVFDDNPPGGAFSADSQLRGAERTGTLFNFNTGALFIVEVQYAINQPGLGGARTSAGLPGAYKLGAWFDTGSFPSQHSDAAGLSLANPARTGISGDAIRQFQFLWCLRSGRVAGRWGRSARGRYFRSCHGRSRRSQSGELQRQCRRGREGSVAHSRQ